MSSRDDAEQLEQESKLQNDQFQTDVCEGNLEAVKKAIEEKQVDITPGSKLNQSAAYWAAEHGRLEILEFLAIQGFDLNHGPKTSMVYGACKTPIEAAANNGHSTVVDFLLKNNVILPKMNGDQFVDAIKKGKYVLAQLVVDMNKRPNKSDDIGNFDINGVNQNGLTPLYIFSRNGELDAVQFLVRQGADVNVSTVNCSGSGRRLPLWAAIQYGHMPVVDFLLQNGVDVNNNNSDERSSALIHAVDYGRVGIMKSLLQVNELNSVGNSNVNGGMKTESSDGKDTPLYHAITFGNADGIYGMITERNLGIRRSAMVECLLNHGAEPLNLDPLKLFRLCAEQGVLPLVQQAIEGKQIDVNCKDASGQTAVYLAAEKTHTLVIEYLVSKGADLNIANKFGQSPLWRAASIKSTREDRRVPDNTDDITSTIECLIQKGGNVNQSDKKSNTALHVAVSQGRETIVECLLINGAAVDQKDGEDQTALNIATEKKLLNIVALLLTHGADINRKDAYGFTPTFWAVQEKDLPLLSVLVTHGADISIKNKEGKTCLDLLSDKDRLKILTTIDMSLLLLESHDYALWFCLVQQDGVATGKKNNAFGKLIAIITGLISSHPTLVTAKDTNGRAAMDVASKPVKAIMQSVLLWHGRYRITEPRPEHISATCFIYKAVDEQTIDSETQQPIKVALKLMRIKNQFLRESGVRDKGFNHEFVMNVIQQMRPTSSSFSPSFGGTFKYTQLGLYSKLTYQYVEKTLVETVYRLRAENSLQLETRYRIAKHDHDFFVARTERETFGINCGLCKSNVAPEYSCLTCRAQLCKKCFDKEDDHLVLEPTEGTTWLLTVQEGKDQPETELARSEGPTVQVSDAVFSSIKVQDGNDAVIVVGEDNEPEPDEVMGVEADATGQLTKANAEKLYFLVMPLADRNLFVALKQERFAGKNMEEVRHVFSQLVHCVEHMHERGVLHADLKPLNIVRTTGQWKLIDLDAACEIGKEPVGHKSSSAYVPPEAIYVDEKSDSACVRSVVAVTKGEANYELLTAHPSFDVWSLGCMLYQMCTADVKPLFQGGQDDNLVGVRKGIDNLFSLSEWSPELKADKLADVPDKLARNLLSQMLHKDPLQRPSLARVLAHSFVSGKKVARLVGEKPKYDVFLSYRVASDSPHVEKLYNLLTAQGFKVYWDKLCLEPGVDWEQGFCEGLVSSRAFVPLLSRDAINHPDKAWQNFSKLATDSNCDNVFLEHRLAVELQGLGLIEKMFPVFIGNLDAATSEYSHYFGSGCHPSLSEVTVNSVEEKLRHHMESQALGTPIVPDRTVKSVVDAITACQGAFIVGPADATFAAAAASIAKMLTDVPVTQSPRGGTHIHQALFNTMDNKALVAKVSALKSENDILKDENSALREKLGNHENANGAVKDENIALKHKVRDALASLRSDKFVAAEAVIADIEALLQG